MTSRQPAHTRKLGQIWGERLKARRQALHLTQVQAATLAGITQESFGAFERGNNIPLDRTKVALARALGTTPGELFPWPPMEELLSEEKLQRAS